MTLHVLFSPEDECAVMVCGVQDLGFGPVVWGPLGPEILNAFIDWIGADPRQFQPHRLDMLFAAFQSSEPFAQIIAANTLIVEHEATSGPPAAVPDETEVPAPVDAVPTADEPVGRVAAGVPCAVCDGAGKLLDGAECPVCGGSGIDASASVALGGGY